MVANKINLLNFDRAQLRDYFSSLNEKPYHADQVTQWVHQYGIVDFDQMTNLSKLLREHLTENVTIQLPTIEREQISIDGTRKWLLRLEDNEFIEMVYIPEEDRGTLCVSSQVGCALNCEFCATGKIGFKRNLTTAEIIGQVWLAKRVLEKGKKSTKRMITNIVLMGMGEPLLNLKSVLPALNLMMDDLAYGLSKYRVTVSTVGIVPAIDELRQHSEASLAVSLHAPNDELRNQLMPINKKYPLAELIPACKRFFAKEPRRQVSIEYIMIAGVNDSIDHAKQLVKLLQGVPCKVNLIPYNANQFSSYQPTAKDQIDHFRHILIKAGINTVTRKKRGADIDAACGQLLGNSEQ